MRARPKKNKTLSKIKKIIAFLLALFLLIFVYFELNVKGQLKNVIVNQMESMTNESVNKAVEEYLENYKNEVDNLVTITENDTKDIKSIKANTYNINKAKVKICELADEKLRDNINKSKISFTVGGFTGLVSLSELGPVIHFDTFARTDTRCEFASTFESVGVNQTLHHIILTVFVDIDVYNPFTIDTFTVSTSYEISQTVIVGTIPSYFGDYHKY